MQARAAPVAEGGAKSPLVQRVDALRKLLDSSKASSQNMSQQIYDLLWDYERLFGESTQEVARSVIARVMPMLIEIITDHQPVLPLVRVVEGWIVGISKTAQDSLQAVSALKTFMSIMQQKSPTPTVKTFAITCCGAIFRGLGMLVGGTINDCSALMLKQLKSSHPPKRSACLEVLKDMISSCGASASFLIPNILKHLKQAVNDKEAEVRAAAAHCLGALAINYSSSNFDSIHHLNSKLIEDFAPNVRMAAAEAIGISHASAFKHSATRALNKKKITESGPSGASSSGSSSSQAEEKDWSIGETLESMIAIAFKPNGLSLDELLRIRASVSFAIVQFFRELKLGQISKSIDLIVAKLLTIILKGNTTPADLAQSHSCVGFIINEGLRFNFGEEEQKSLVKVLIKYIAQYTDNETICALCLRQLSNLLLDLGPGATEIFAVLQAPLLKLLSHPNQTVQVVSAITCRTLALALHDQLAGLLRSCLTKLASSIAEVASSASPSKEMFQNLQGSSRGVAGLVSVIPKCTFGVSNDLTAEVFEMAKMLLQEDQHSKNPTIAIIRTQAAWSILSSLMCLGPMFVENLLGEILDLWRNNLLKEIPLLSEKHIYVFCQLKSLTLNSIYTFVLNNPTLTTQEITNPLVLMLENILKAITAITPDVLKTISPKTVDVFNIFKTNVVKVFKVLPKEFYVSSYVTMLRWCMAEIIKGPMTSMFGQNLNKDDDVIGPRPLDSEMKKMRALIPQSSEIQDVSVIWRMDPDKELQNPIPTGKKLTDEMLDLVSDLVLTQDAKNRMKVFQTFFEAINKTNTGPSSSQPINHERIALQANTCYIIHKTFSLLLAQKKNFPPDQQALVNLLQQFISPFFVHADTAFKRMAAQIIGQLCAIQGPQFTEKQLALVLSVMKDNKDVQVKACYSLVLGSILRSLGSMQSGRHLLTVVTTLHGILKDPQPMLLIWALHSLWLAIDTCGLAFAPYADATMALAYSLFFHPNVGVQENLRVSSFLSIGRVINGTISAMGPELEPTGQKLRNCKAVINELLSNSNPLLQLEAIELMQQLALFAPQVVKVPEFIPSLRQQFKSADLDLRKASITCLRQLAQFDPISVDNFSLSGPSSSSSSSSSSAKGQRQPSSSKPIEEELLMMMDQERDSELRNELQLLITSLMEYTCVEQPGKWLKLFKATISASVGAAGGESGGLQMPTNSGNDEENADDSGSLTGTQGKQDATEAFTPRWRTRVFCTEQLSRLIDVIAHSDKRAPHFNLALARESLERSHNQSDFLISHLSDIMTLAFNCATSLINALQPVGVSLMREIVNKFRDADDPDYEGHKLIEVYSAQVAAALRPAFSFDSPPSLTAAACSVAVSFLTTNIASEPVALRKVVSLLTGTLDTLSALRYPAYNETASTMVQLSILGALAELHIASLNTSSSGSDSARLSLSASSGSLSLDTTTNLSSLLRPYLHTLQDLWIDVLRDYAVLSTQSPIIQEAYNGRFYNYTSISFVLQYYKKTWAPILLAVSSLIDSRYWDQIPDAQEADESQAHTQQLSKEEVHRRRAEDFEVMFGLIIANLSAADDDEATLYSLKAVGNLLSSSFSRSIESYSLFAELIEVLILNLQIGTSSIKSTIASVANKIVSRLPPDYFGGPNVPPAMSVLTCYSLLELCSFGLASNSSPLDEVQETIAKLNIESLGLICRLFSDEMVDQFLPIVTNLIFNATTARLSSAAIVGSAIKAVTLISTETKSTESLRVLLAALNAVCDLVEPSASSSSSSPSSGVSLLNSNSLLLLSSLVLAAIEHSGDNEQSDLTNHASMFSKCVTILSFSALSQDHSLQATAIQVLSTISNMGLKKPALVPVLFPILQKTSASIFRFLLDQSRHSAANQHLVSECIKLLIIFHTLTPNKTAFLGLMIPTLVQLLNPQTEPKPTQEFSLQVLQSLGAADPLSFKSNVDLLEPSTRRLLENALVAQEQHRQQISAQLHAREQARLRAKAPLKLDLSQFDE